jgi:predicted MFS family arabinose efflux permease
MHGWYSSKRASACAVRGRPHVASLHVNVVELIAPARLGQSFRWLLSSTVISNIGDGIAVAAGPLLVASATQDPVLVASAALLLRLPWLLFGVVAGAYVDRLDRRLLVIAVDSFRAFVLAALTLTIVTGVVNITLVLIAMFVLGTAETFADIASQTLLPSVVGSAGLGIANARMQGGFLVSNQLIGPPIGALLFTAGRSWPFAAIVVCCLLGALLMVRVSVRPVAVVERRAVRHEIAEGIQWLWQHAPMRTLAITIVLFNVTFGAAWSVLVLYSTNVLHMSEAGFGLLITAGAVGGLVGTTSYGWLEQHFSLATLMRIGLVIEAFTHLSLALTRQPWVAVLVMVVFGAHAFVWGTTSTTIRQRAVPGDLLGRVTSVYMIGVIGGLVVGIALGGVLADVWGLTAPFWFGFVGSGLLVALLWRELGHIAHAGEAPVTV